MKLINTFLTCNELQKGPKGFFYFGQFTIWVHKVISHNVNNVIKRAQNFMVCEIPFHYENVLHK